MQQETRDKIVPLMMKLLREYGAHTLREEFLEHRNTIPRERLYQETLDVYYKVGFDFPKEAILDIMELRPDNYLDNLPEKYKCFDEIPVIRVSTTPPQSVQNVVDEISWAAAYKYAVYFHEAKRRLRKKKSYFYIGTIRKEDIIGIKCEPCFELVQVGAMQNITLVPPQFVAENLDRDVTFDDFAKVKERYGNLATAFAKMSVPV